MSTFGPLLQRLLAHPLTRDLNIDSAQTTELRRKIISAKPFLKSIYVDWYKLLANHVPESPEPALELGSGAGFFKGYVPRLITSEVLRCSEIDVVLDGQMLPFADSSLRAIVMTDVLHHISDCKAFFREAERCLTCRGRLVMLEPWVTWWSRFVYTFLHHEPFHPDSQDWGFPAGGALSGANGAIPWIVFDRDRKSFEEEFGHLTVTKVMPMMPFRYLVSGGISMRAMMPSFLYPVWRAIDRLFPGAAMFAFIVVEKK